MQTITRAKGGTDEQVIKVEEIQIPDLWHIAMMFREVERGEATISISRASGKMKVSPELAKRIADDILECWHLCNDLLNNISPDRYKNFKVREE